MKAYVLILLLATDGMHGGNTYGVAEFADKEACLRAAVREEARGTPSIRIHGTCHPRERE